MVRVGDLLAWKQLDDVVLDLARRLARGKTRTVRDPKDVRVDRKFGLGKHGGHDDITGFSWQRQRDSNLNPTIPTSSV